MEGQATCTWIMLVRTHADMTIFQCEYFQAGIERAVSAEAGIFGIGADYGKIRELRARKSPACEQLKQWGRERAQGQAFY